MSYSSEVLADSPLIYWRLGETSGTVAADSSGNSNDGTYVGSPTLDVLPGLLANDADSAVDFPSAAGTYVESAAFLGPTTYAAFTLEVLLNIDASSGPNLLTLRDPTTVAPDFMALYAPGGNLLFDFQGTSAYSPSAVVMALPQGIHHVAATYDGTNLKLYLNGLLADTQAFIDAGALLTVSNVFYAGGAVGGAPSANGVLDEPAFYTTALSAARIAAHAAASSPYAAAVKADSPVFYWRLSEQSGIAAFDDSGNGNTGTYESDASYWWDTSLLTNDPNNAMDMAPTGSPPQWVATPTTPTYLDGSLTAWTMEIIVGPLSGQPSDQLFGSVPASPYLYHNGSDQIEIDGASITVIDTTGTDLTVAHHVVATYDGATTLLLYIDGALVASGTGETAFPSGTGPWDVGYQFGTSQWEADEAAFYDYALSAGRVLVHYNLMSGNSGTTTDQELDTSTTPTALLNTRQPHTLSTATASPTASLTTLHGTGHPKDLVTVGSSSGSLALRKGVSKRPTATVITHPTLAVKPSAMILRTSVLTAASLAIPQGQTLMSMTDSLSSPICEVVLQDQRVGVNILVGGNLYHYPALSTIADQNWHSYAVALDLALQTGTLYVDGRTEAAFPIDSGSFTSGTGQWFLGARPTGTRFFKGGLDEFATVITPFDETTAYQVTTTGTAGTMLTVNHGSASTFAVRPSAAMTTVAVLIPQKTGAPTNLVTDQISAVVTIDINAVAHLEVLIPTAPTPSPQTWTATTTAYEPVGTTSLSVQPLDVAIPAGSILYFPISTVINVGGGGGGAGGAGFSSYPSQGSPITISSQSNVVISGKSFTGINDVAIQLLNCTNVYIHDCDFDNNVGDIYLQGCTGQLRIENIRARNTGDNSTGSGHSNVIQFNNSFDNGSGGIRNVIVYGGQTEDMISMFESGGLDANHQLIIENCHFESPLPSDPLAWSSNSGTGFLLGDVTGSDIVVRNCTLLNVGQVGIGISRGVRMVVTNNVIYGAQRLGSNTGIYTPYSGTMYVGNNEVSHNRVWWIQEDGSPNPYYNPGISGAITGWSTNTFQDSTIDPNSLTIDPTTMVFGGQSKPPAGGYFSILPPGSTFPSDSQAAAMVHYSSWEPRTDNTTANHFIPTQPLTLGIDTDDFDAYWNAHYLPRVTGNFAGTTDEIIQWAAAKWGWSDELVRAEAVSESNWHQNQLGDYEPAGNGHRVYDRVDDPSPTSFSIIQIRWYYHPPHFASNSPQSSYPNSRLSTAFALDFFLSILRGIYDGHSTYLGGGGAATVGDYWGAIGSWFSGDWHGAGAESYIAGVQGHLANKEWLTW